MPNETYTPSQLAEEVQILAENYTGAVIEIEENKTNIANAYSEAEIKGATMPVNRNSANLADTVASIPEAVQPTLITKQITANGTYTAAEDNADGFSDVTVDVPDESKAVLDSLIDRSIATITSDVTSIGNYAFRDCTALTEVSFPNVTSIGNGAFQNCTAIKYFDMSEVSGVPSISSTTFKGTTCIFLFRDQTQLDTYASATNWSALADRFQIKGATP